MQSKTFPTQGGRWPGGPDEGTLLNRKHIQRTNPPHRRNNGAWTGLTLLYCLHVEPEQDDIAVLDVPNGTRPGGAPPESTDGRGTGFRPDQSSRRGE